MVNLINVLKLPVFLFFFDRYLRSTMGYTTLNFIYWENICGNPRFFSDPDFAKDGDRSFRSFRPKGPKGTADWKVYVRYIWSMGFSGSD
jgi:phospholipase C